MKGFGKKGEKGGLSRNIKQGFIAITNNLNLFLPDIFLGLVIFSMALLFIFINDFVGLFASLAKASETARLGVIQDFFSNIKSNSYTLWKMIISIGVFVAIAILASVKFNSIKYDMMKDYIEGKGVSFIQSYKRWAHYFWRVFFVKLLLFIIFFAVILFAAFVIGLFGAVLYKFAWGRILLILIGLLLVFVGMIWVKLLTLFVFPALFLEGFTTIKSFKRSFGFFNKNKKYVASIFLIIVGISILASIATLITNALSGMFQGFGVVSAAIVIAVFISLVNAIIRMALVLWADLFLFLGYKKN